MQQKTIFLCTLLTFTYTTGWIERCVILIFTTLDHRWHNKISDVLYNRYFRTRDVKLHQMLCIFNISSVLVLVCQRRKQWSVIWPLQFENVSWIEIYRRFATWYKSSIVYCNKVVGVYPQFQKWIIFHQWEHFHRWRQHSSVHLWVWRIWITRGCASKYFRVLHFRWKGRTREPEISCWFVINFEQVKYTGVKGFARNRTSRRKWKRERAWRR